MAVQRLTLNQIITQILNITGFDSSDVAPWESDANLTVKINMTTQKIGQKVARIILGTGADVSKGNVKLDMWRSSADSTASTGAGNLVVSSGSSTVQLPADYDHWKSFWDSDLEQWFYPIERNHTQYMQRLLKRPPGPPEAIEILGYGGTNWQRQCTLYPTPPTGVTPSITLDYWRIPAVMPGSDADNEYPDGDYKFHYLWVLEPVLELLRPDDAAYNRYKEVEQEMMLELAATARSV